MKRLKYFAPTQNFKPPPPGGAASNLVNDEPSLRYVLPALPPEEPPIS